MSSYSKTINELVEYLNVCRDSYYNRNVSLITDEQYDKLFDELVDLEKASGIILANSPTQTVGYEVKSDLQKVEHAYPLLSLDKIKRRCASSARCRSRPRPLWRSSSSRTTTKRKRTEKPCA